jgi:hypothetical protein
VAGLSKVVQDSFSVFGGSVPLLLRQVEAQYCGCETGYQGGAGAETCFVRILERDAKVEEAAGAFSPSTGVGVVGLVCENVDGGGGDSLVGRQAGGDVG